MSTVFVTTPSGFLESQPPNAIDVDNEEEISSTKALYVPSSPTSTRCRRKSSSRTREDMMNKMWKRRGRSYSNTSCSGGYACGSNWVQSIEIFGQDIASLVPISVLSNNVSSFGSIGKKNNSSNNSRVVKSSEDLMDKLSFDNNDDNDEDDIDHDDDNETIYPTKTFDDNKSAQQILNEMTAACGQGDMTTFMNLAKYDNVMDVLDYAVTGFDIQCLGKE